MKFAEPDYVVKAQLTSNDPRYGSLWGMEKIRVQEAWNLATGGVGGNDPTVCVIDTGVDGSHPDLKG